jgi:hypothetical protein
VFANQIMTFRKPLPPRQPNPGEQLFDVAPLFDHILFRCELWTWPQGGVEDQ